MPLYVRDGFEHGDIGVYNTVAGSPSFVSSPVRTGSDSLEIASVTANESVLYNLPAGSRQVTETFYIRFAELPPDPSFTVLSTFAVTGAGGAFRYNPTDVKFEIIAGTAISGGPTVVINTWYLVDLFFDTSTGTQSLKCKIDGGTEFEMTRVIAAADITSVRIGQNDARTITAYYDDWGISLTNGDYPIGAHAYLDPTLTQRVGVGRSPGN